MLPICCVPTLVQCSWRAICHGIPFHVPRSQGFLSLENGSLTIRQVSRGLLEHSMHYPQTLFDELFKAHPGVVTSSLVGHKISEIVFGERSSP